MAEKHLQLTDDAMIAGIRKQNEIIIERMYVKFYPYVFKLVLSNSGNKSDARDLMQESMMVLIGKIRSQEFYLTAALSTFFYAIAKNMWLKKLRGRVVYTDEAAKLVDYSDVDIEDAPDERIDAIANAMKLLTDKCRELIQATYYSRKADKQIAVEQGLSGADYVKTQRYRCLKRLRELCKA